MEIANRGCSAVSARQFTVRRRRGGALVLLGPERVYKVALNPQQMRQIRDEVAGNRAAQGDAFWRGAILPARPVPLGLVSPRAVALAPADPVIARYLAAGLQRVERKPVRPADQLVQRHLFETLMSQRGADQQRGRILHYLSDFRIPESSAHGDLNAHNFLVWNGRVVVIDWGLYRPVSSFIFDAAHHYIIHEAMRARLSWIDVVFDSMPRASAIQALARRFDLTVRQLIVAYAMNRADTEGEQFRRLNGALPARFRSKYERVYARIDQWL